MSEPKIRNEYLLMVFDVESVGLHGEGFAVGYTVVGLGGKEHEYGTFSCAPDMANGRVEDRKWVRENVPIIRVTHKDTQGVRDAFFYRFSHWREKGALLFADCAWPVEARFMAACIDDQPELRTWCGPYPLHDIASFIFARGVNPLAKFPRQFNEIPEHNPLNDARQSARILLEAMNTKAEKEAK